MGEQPIAERLGDAPKPDWVSGCGTVVLYCADSVELTKALPDIDCVFTSPPYADVREYGGEWGDWQSVVPPVISACRRVATHTLVNLGLIHRDGVVVPYWDALFSDGMPTGWYVWDKLHSLPGKWRNRCGPSHEFLFHFNNGGDVRRTVRCTTAHTRISSTGTGQRKADGTADRMNSAGKIRNEYRVPDSVFRVRGRWGDDERFGHPAEMPERLPRECIPAFCDERGIVLDPFVGSGTTGVAAARLERQFIGIEIDPDYFAIAVKRIDAELGRFPLFDPPAPKQGGLFEEATDGRRSERE